MRSTGRRKPQTLSQREPILNIPGVIAVLAGMMILVHGWRVFILDPETDTQVLLTFAFIPARFERSLAASWGFPGGLAADIWSFVSYAFLHADWTHLSVNVLWFVVFGSPVARRFGTARSLVFFVVTAAAGAVAHLVTSDGQSPMIGASAAVSGFTAAAVRFVFQRGGPLGPMRSTDPGAYHVPALSLPDLARNGTAMGMIIIWIVLNVVFGAVSLPIAGAEGQIAWQAHLGGFVAGLVLFRLFDPVPA